MIRDTVGQRVTAGQSPPFNKCVCTVKIQSYQLKDKLWSDYFLHFPSTKCSLHCMTWHPHLASLIPNLTRLPPTTWDNTTLPTLVGTFAAKTLVCTLTHAHTYTCMYMHLYALMHTQIHTSHTDRCTYTHTHACTHTQAHRHIHIHRHTHTNIPCPWCFSMFPLTTQSLASVKIPLSPAKLLESFIIGVLLGFLNGAGPPRPGWAWSKGPKILDTQANQRQAGKDLQIDYDMSKVISDLDACGSVQSQRILFKNITEIFNNNIQEYYRKEKIEWKSP